MLEALAGPPNPADPRTKDQRRADALVDLLLGRISNGWHGPDCWDGAGDPDDDSDSGGDTAAVALAEADPTADHEWDEDAEWELPASAFRPDPRHEAESDSGAPETDVAPGGAPIGEAAEKGRPAGCHGQPPPRVTIGVVVSIQSLFGFSDTPGELANRSALVPAELVRALAGHEGTLFYRLLTDPTGNLLDVAEMGRFPSRKLTGALRFRDGVCTNPICHVAAQRCDLDHAVPWPEGLTAAGNVGARCRNDHRAKTHGGFGVTMSADGTTWTTPTGHRYRATTDPLPVEEWPDTG
jgi:hypothetical protein